MKQFFANKFLPGLLGLLSLSAGPALAAPFLPGNVVVARVGATGATAALASVATAVFLDEYTPAGVLVQSIALPTAASGVNLALTASGSATSELNLTRSADGRYLVLTGYDAPVGTAGVGATANPGTARVIARIGADGVVNTTTAIGDAFGGNSIRMAATTNGQNFYAGGGNSGVRYVPFGNPATAPSTAINTNPVNIRFIGAFGGNLYVTSGSGAPLLGVSQIGTGLPTTGGQTNTVITGTASLSPYAFFFADLNPAVAGVDVLYVADDDAAGGIQKYSLVGSTWTLNGTVGPGAAAVRGLAGRVVGTAVTLFATGPASLYTLADNAGYNAAPGTATLPTAVATAGTNTAFRGVALAPTLTGTATRASQALPGLAVFPSPATDRLTVDLPTAGAATVALRDLAGRLVLAPAALGPDQQLRLPAGLPVGIYLLEVRQGNVTAVRRIEKN